MAKKSHRLATGQRRNSKAPELRSAMLRILDRRIVGRGDVVFPCVPALAGQYALKLLGT